MKRILNIDKLELSFDTTDEQKDYLSSKDIHEFNDFILIKNKSECSYKYCFDIILQDSTKFGQLYYESYNLNRKKIYIYINNIILYNYNLNILYDIQYNLNIEFFNISKLDLALDFQYNFINKFYKLIKDNELDLIVLNKCYKINDDITSLLNISTGNRKNIHKFKSFYINNLEGGLTLNAYNKTKEIKDNSYKKDYIIQHNKFKNIFRLEIRTRHHILLDSLKKVGFTDLYLLDRLINKDTSELYLIYQNLLNRLIRIRYKNTSFSLLDFI